MERIESPTNIISPRSKPYVQNMEIRFRRESHLDSHFNSIQVPSMAPLKSRVQHKNFKSEIKSINSNLCSFKQFDSQSKQESIGMRYMSRDFQDSPSPIENPMENISTSLDDSSRCSPRFSGGGLLDDQRERGSFKTLSQFKQTIEFQQSVEKRNPRIPISRLKTGKMNNYFKNNCE